MINPMTRQRVREAPADKRVLYAEIIYPFPEKDKTLKPQLDPNYIPHSIFAFRNV